MPRLGSAGRDNQNGWLLHYKMVRSKDKRGQSLGMNRPNNAMIHKRVGLCYVVVQEGPEHVPLAIGGQIED